MTNHSDTFIPAVVTLTYIINIRATTTLPRLHWPENFKDCFEPAKPYYSLRDKFFVADDILLFVTRIVVPRIMRYELLQRIHIQYWTPRSGSVTELIYTECVLV